MIKSRCTGNSFTRISKILFEYCSVVNRLHFIIKKFGFKCTRYLENNQKPCPRTNASPCTGLMRFVKNEKRKRETDGKFHGIVVSCLYVAILSRPPFLLGFFVCPTNLFIFVISLDLLLLKDKYSLVQWIGYTFDAVWSQIYFIPHQKCIQIAGPYCILCIW